MTTRDDGPTLEETDPRLVSLLREAGGEWGPLGVARTAAKLVEVAEAEAVDPVEQKAKELYQVGNPGTVCTWESTHEAFKDWYRRIAAHVLGQEAGDE